MYSVSSGFRTESRSIISNAQCTLTVDGTEIGGITDVTIMGSLGDSGALTVGAFVSKSLSFTCLSSSLPSLSMTDVIEVSLGYVVNGEKQVIPMGQFYTAPKYISHKNLLSVVQAYDQAWTLSDTYTSGLSYPTSALAVMTEIAAGAGITVKQNSAYSRLSQVTVHEALKGQYRGVIAGVAMLIGCNAMFDREGLLEFMPVNISETPVDSYTAAHYRNDTYILTSDEPIVFGQVTCTYTHEEEQDEESEITEESWTYSAVAGSRGLSIESQNIRSQAEVNRLGAYIVGSAGVSYYGYSLTLFGQPQLDLGDRITVLDPDGEEYEFLIASMTHNYTGAMTTAITAVIPEDDALEISGDNPTGSLTYAVSNAQAAADSAAVAAKNAHAAADDAMGAALAAHAAADDARDAADAAQGSADEAKASAKNANDYAARALGNLSTVQSVAETLTWIAQHGTMTLTTDTELDPTHVYFVEDPDGDYEISGRRYAVVPDPDVADLSSYYQLSIDESLNNYVGTHLALTGEGLWLIPDSTDGNRVLISTGSAGQAADMSVDIADNGELSLTNNSNIPVSFELTESGVLSYSTGPYETAEFTINSNGELVLERADSPYTAAGTYILDGDGVIVGAFLSNLAQIGPSSAAHTEIDSNGQRTYGADGSTILSQFTPTGSQIGRLADWHVELSPTELAFTPPTGSGSELVKILSGSSGYAQLLFSYEDSGYLYETYLCNGEVYMLRYNQSSQVDAYSSLTVDGLAVNDGNGESAFYGAGSITAGGHPSGLLAEEVTIASSLSVGHGNYKLTSKSVAKTGYTPLGIVGFRMGGAYQSFVNVYSSYLSGTTANFSLRNMHTTTDASVDLYATILYAKS